MKRVFRAAISSSFLLVFMLPSLTSAATVEELQAQIQELLQKLKGLQEQLAQAQGAQPQRWCHDFNKNLRIGDGGPEITALQNAFSKEGFDVSDTETTPGTTPGVRVGVFGEQTAAAVTGFQEKYKDEILRPNGLAYGTGFVGKSTRAKLNQLYGCGVLPPPTTQPSITVLSPNGGESYRAGDIVRIKWTTSNVDKAGPANISLLTADGTALITYIAGTKVEGIDAQTGYYDWVISSTVQTGSYRMRIAVQVPNLSGYGTAQEISDQSDSYFKINSSVVTQSSVTVTSPNGGETWSPGSSYTIKYNLQNWDKASLLIYLEQYHPDSAEKKGVNSSYLIGETYNSDGYYYNVPTWQQSGNTYKIKVCDKYYVICDSSDSYFSIGSSAQPSITVTSPNGGESWAVGSTQTIKWSGASNQQYAIFLNGKAYPNYEIARWVNGNSYNWVVPAFLSPDQYVVKVCASSLVQGEPTCTASDSSDASFSVVVGAQQSVITALSPVGEEKWLIGDQQKIVWDGGSDITNYSVELWTADKDLSWSLLSSSSGTKSYLWKVGSINCLGAYGSCATALQSTPRQYQIRVKGHLKTDGEGQFNVSSWSNIFTIADR